MASNVRVKIHLSGVRQVFNDPAVTADLMRRAEAIANAANGNVASHEGDKPSSYPRPHHKVIAGTTRYGNSSALVVTDTNEARAMQAKHSTFTQAIDAGR